MEDLTEQEVKPVCIRTFWHCDLKEKPLTEVRFLRMLYRVLF